VQTSGPVNTIVVEWVMGSSVGPGSAVLISDTTAIDMTAKIIIQQPTLRSSKLRISAADHAVHAAPVVERPEHRLRLRIRSIDCGRVQITCGRTARVVSGLPR
jgi:hypothetical protein